MPAKIVPTGIKKCNFCQKKFKRKRINGRLEDRTVFMKKKFCGRKCANSRKKVGKHGLCVRARKHLKDRCNVCMGKYLLAAHHIDGNRENNSSSNIETLCVVCHAKHHHGTLNRNELQLSFW